MMLREKIIQPKGRLFLVAVLFTVILGLEELIAHSIRDDAKLGEATCEFVRWKAADEFAWYETEQPTMILNCDGFTAEEGTSEAVMEYLQNSEPPVCAWYETGRADCGSTREE